MTHHARSIVGATHVLYIDKCRMWLLSIKGASPYRFSIEPTLLRVAHMPVHIGPDQDVADPFHIDIDTQNTAQIKAYLAPWWVLGASIALASQCN